MNAEQYLNINVTDVIGIPLRPNPGRALLHTLRERSVSGVSASSLAS